MFNGNYTKVKNWEHLCTYESIEEGKGLNVYEMVTNREQKFDRTSRILAYCFPGNIKCLLKGIINAGK